MASPRDTVPIAGDLLDAAGRLVRCNRACERVSGYGERDLRDAPLQELLVPADEHEVAVAAAARLTAGESPVTYELHWRRRDGELRLISWSTTALTDADGRVTHLVSSGQDVTDERRAATERAAVEERLSIAFEHAPIGMSLASLDGRFLRVNPRLCELLGHSEQELLAQTAFDVTHPEDVPVVESVLLAAAEEGDLPVVVVRALRKDGSEVWVELHFSLVPGPGGGAEHVLTQVLDVTARRQLEQRLRHLANHDSLTGLFNRRRFEEELERHLAHGRRYGMDGALLVLDLDGFKDVNDRYGHRAGDRVLASVAGVLRKRLRESDIVARFGGDEFAVLLPHAGEPEASNVADTVGQAISSEVTVPGGQLTASVGYALFTEGVLSPDDVLSTADTAMYARKARRGPGGGRQMDPLD